MSRGPDFQKHEAKRSLWDEDGQHIPKRYRNKSKGRFKDKQLIRTESAEIDADLTTQTCDTESKP
jgi:hypothetical protein